MKHILILTAALMLSGNAFAQEDCRNEAWQFHHLCRIANAIEKIAERETLSISKAEPCKGINCVQVQNT